MKRTKELHISANIYSWMDQMKMPTVEAMILID
jgi:hypothetical protein